MTTVWYSIYNFGMGESKNKFLEISRKKKRIEHCLAISKKFHSKYAYLQFAFSHDHIAVITVSATSHTWWEKLGFTQEDSSRGPFPTTI